MLIKRREFLQVAKGVGSVLAIDVAVPDIFRQFAISAEESRASDKVLIVVQLSGGNDGLNTVIPFRDDNYYRARPKLNIPEDQAVRVADDVGLHPSMSGIGELFQTGCASIVQGVGYENPNRSHFESMDIWHTCQRKAQRSQDGWIGRYLSQTKAFSGDDSAAIHLGAGKQPVALASQSVPSPSIAALDRFRLSADGPKSESTIRSLVEMERKQANGLLDFISSRTQSAFVTSQRIELAKRDYRSSVEYPNSSLAAKFRTVAQFIDAGLKTRIYYLELDGFDTHAQQAQAHSALLTELSRAIKAFHEDIVEHGHADRVLTFAFSEFGRRVKENASEGTDHGAAAPVFLFGKQVAAGLIGAMPSLTDLVDGDQKFHTDFRRVFATLIERWLGGNSEPILGGRFEILNCLA